MPIGKKYLETEHMIVVHIFLGKRNGSGGNGTIMAYRDECDIFVKTLF